MPKKRPTDDTSLLPKGPPRSRGARTGMIRARVAPELKAGSRTRSCQDRSQFQRRYPNVLLPGRVAKGPAV
jgi:hypothetical protein